MTTKSIASALSTSAPHPAPTLAFVRHFFEMLVAMVVGMVVLGALVSLLLAVLGHANLSHHAALRALAMATYMAVGMSAWMRYRRHSWPRVREMAGAMFAPFLLLLIPFWAGLITASVFLAGGHLLMVPFMLGAMLYRRAEYARSHPQYSKRPGRLT